MARLGSMPGLYTEQKPASALIKTGAASARVVRRLKVRAVWSRRTAARTGRALVDEPRHVCTDRDLDHYINNAGTILAQVR
jgi:hypothetical protein